jgi:hypothetical protein
MTNKPILHPFSVTSDEFGIDLHGMATVAEVVPTVFVFSIYDTTGQYISQHVTTTLHPESPSLPKVRAAAIEPTALDRAAYDRYCATLVTRKR